MGKLVLEEIPFKDDLFPFTLTRSVTAIRIGILTLQEKWDRLLEGKAIPAPLTIPANILPTRQIVEAILSGDAAIALSEADRIQYPWHIFQLNEKALISDFALLTAGRRSQPIPPSVQAISTENIFIEEGASIDYTILNASAGPIYIGKNATIMEGSLIRGPFALCEGAVIKMGAKIYGATTIGPYCVAGGEIKNSVLFGYSNKAHDGYLGDSVIGEWCNLGAGTSNSNLKNSAGAVKVWHHASKRFINAGLKCGLLMGDYSRSAINSSFNTGTVAGVSCNIFGEGLLPKFISSFSWGTEPGYKWELALRDIGNWKKLKNQTLTDAEIQDLKHIFEQS